MAQTTDSFSPVNGTLEYTITASATTPTWISVGGQTINVVHSGGGEREVGQRFTLEGDTAVLTEGKLTPFEIQVTVLGEDDGGGFAAILRDQKNRTGSYVSPNSFAIRWAPAGTATGNILKTSSTPTMVKTAPEESADAENGGNPIDIQATLTTPRITNSIIA